MTLSSCDNDDGKGTVSPSILGSTTIDGAINKNGSLSSLNAALDAAPGDLPTALNGEGTFTLFAPDNGAFDDLAARTGFESADDLLANIDPALLGTILNYHLVAGENGAGDLADGTTLSTSAGGELTITVDGDVILVSDATKLPQKAPTASVVQSNPDPANGTIHVVSRVLLPQEAVDALNLDIRPSILEWATSTENLSTLASAVTKAGLVDILSELDTSTVLAPTNEAFANLLNDLGDDYNSLDDFDNDAEIAVLGDILKYHVLPGVADVMVGPVATALEGSSVEVIAGVGGFAFEDITDVDANIVTADIEANNGAIQIVDKVLLPQAALDFTALLASDDLATTVTSTPDLSILAEALAATELVDPFVDTSNESFVQGEEEEDEDFEERRTPSNYTYFKPATVFAPSNTAFEELLEALGPNYTGIDSFDTEEDMALLTEILTYHVVEGEITSNDLEAGSLTTLAESDIEIVPVLGTDSFVIGDASNNVNANFVLTDVMARNGVAHVIDKVLLPQSAVDFIISLNEEEEEDN